MTLSLRLLASGVAALLLLVGAQEAEEHHEVRNLMKRVNLLKTAKSPKWPVATPAITHLAFFNVTLDGVPWKNPLIFLLYRAAAPNAVDNFLALCTGEKGYGYAGSRFYEAVANDSIKAGDIVNDDGTGGKSIFGRPFPMEANHATSLKTYMLAMVADESSHVDSRFMVAMNAAWKKNDHVFIGRMVIGHRVMQAMNARPGKPPQQDVRITVCWVKDLPEPKLDDHIWKTYFRDEL